jgi:hypothetical protein
MKKVATNVEPGLQPTSNEHRQMLAEYNRLLRLENFKNAQALLAAKISVTNLSSENSNTPCIPTNRTPAPTARPSPVQTQVRDKSKVTSPTSGIPSKEVISSHPDPSPSDKAARIIVHVHFDSEITQAYGVPIKGNSKDIRQLYWSEPGNQPGTEPADWATNARRNAITLLLNLMEDQPTQSFAVVAADAGLIVKKVHIYDTKVDRIVRYRWVSGRNSLEDLRLKDESPERYVVLPLLPPNKKLAAHVTIMNDKTGAKLSGSAAPACKQWQLEPLKGWKLCLTRDARKQAYTEGCRFAQVACNGVPRRDASEKRIFPNWQAIAHCLEFATLAHLCAGCLRK